MNAWGLVGSARGGQGEVVNKGANARKTVSNRPDHGFETLPNLGIDSTGFGSVKRFADLVVY